MKNSPKLQSIVWLIVFSSLSFHTCRAEPVDESVIDAKLAAIAKYQQGTSRTPLIEVEDMIRQTQDQPQLRLQIRKKLSDMLNQDISFDCKTFICRQLFYLGPDDALPTLANMLKDEQTVNIACYALGINPLPAIDTVLWDTIPQVDGKRLISILNLLGQRKNPDSAAVISPLASNSDEAISAAALSALGKIGGEAARQTLVEVRAKGDPEHRMQATYAYLQYAQELIAQGNNEQASRIYEELSSTNETSLIRGAAMNGLAEVNEAKAIELALSALRENDPLTKRLAIGCIRKTRGTEVVQLLAKELPKLDPDLQILLIATLADMNNKAALPVITNSVKSDHAEVKIAALNALGTLGNTTSVALLAEAAISGETEKERSTAQYSLKAISGVGIDDAIIREMKNTKAKNRPVLIDILAQRNAISAVPELLKQAESSDKEVSRSAFRALARLAGEKDLAAMLEIAIRLPSESARKEAEQAIVQVARLIPDENRQADATLAVYQKEKQIPVRCSLLRMLGGVANDKALEALQTAASEKDAAIQDAAVRALAGWPNSKATGSLMETIKKTENETHRILALRGYVRLLNLPNERPVEDTLNMYWQAMAAASQPAQKKLILSGLANINHPQALAIVLSCLDNEAIRQEAALALLKIAQEIKTASPREVQAAMEKLQEVIKNEPLRQQASEILLDVIEPVSIFDGTTFTGWEGNLEVFRIEEGTIVGGNLNNNMPQNEFLCTQKEYADFELHLQVKLMGDAAHANAGIQIRSRRVPNHHEVSGYQADMGQQYWGSLYDEARRNKILAQADMTELDKVLRRDDWNDYVIRCLGNRIQLWINGYQTVDYTEADEQIEQTGIIGLQIHGGPPSQACYKNIMIKKIK